jgi:mRNA-degrading endonuclease RelE of RelBE toxin-antitoxin system
MSPSASMAVQIQKLNSTQRKEVSDFVEFLLTRRRHSTSEKRRNERLAKISVWSNNDITPIEEAMTNLLQA